MQTSLQPDDTCASVVASDIVLGVQWHARPEAADLDAICELRDEHGRLAELVGPGRLRNFNGSVMHTGDARTGTSRWDNERIFVFIDALPDTVHSLVFTISSSSGMEFRNIPGASCHLSDNSTDEKFLTVHLTDLGTVTEHAIATLQRTAQGWMLIHGRTGPGLV